MEITTHARHGRTVLRVKGRIVGADIVQYSREIEAVCSSSSKDLLVDLSDVTALESPALGATAYSSVILKKAGKNLVVLAPAHIKELFVLCNLDKSIKIICTEEIVAPEELVAAAKGVAGNRARPKIHGTRTEMPAELSLTGT